MSLLEVTIKRLAAYKPAYFALLNRMTRNTNKETRAIGFITFGRSRNQRARAVLSGKCLRNGPWELEVRAAGATLLCQLAESFCSRQGALVVAQRSVADTFREKATEGSNCPLPANTVCVQPYM